MKHGHRLLIGTLVTVVLAVALALLAGGGQGAQATDGILYVDYSALGTDDCTSWVDACRQLSKALGLAVAGDQIWVAEGTYMPTWEFSPGDPRSATFQMKDGVAIYGGFDPPAAVNWEDRDWLQYDVRLSGDLGLPGDPSDNSYHVFYHPPETGLGDSAILDGFWIVAGVADGSVGPHDNGAGMFNDGVSPALNNLYFAGNRAQSAGGGIYNVNGASPTLVGCSFGDNWSGEQGGGMANYGSSPRLKDCIFEGNTTDGAGGGLFNDSSSPVLEHCEFVSNAAALAGGGLYNTTYSSPELTDCEFGYNWADDGGGIGNYDGSSPILSGVHIYHNSAPNSGGGMYNSGSSPELTVVGFEENSAVEGGGIYNVDGSSPTLTECWLVDNSADHGGAMANLGSAPTLSTCTFLHNYAAVDGGGIYNADCSSPGLAGCTFENNMAARHGGAIYNDNFSSPALSDCTFLTNSAEIHGGGIYNDSSAPTLSGCTFEGNDAQSNGGGIYNDSSSPVLTNCTFWRNTARNGGGVYNQDSSPTFTNCTFSSNWAYSGAGGVLNDLTSAPIVTNCILWDDTPDEIAGGSPAVNYSDLMGGYAGTDNIDENPAFVDPANGDFHLKLGSPCIDAGSNAAPSLPDHDFEGDMRVVDGDADGIATVDMGVDEVPIRLYLPLVLRNY